MNKKNLFSVIAATGIAVTVGNFAGEKCQEDVRQKVYDITSQSNVPNDLYQELSAWLNNWWDDTELDTLLRKIDTSWLLEQDQKKRHHLKHLLIDVHSSYTAGFCTVLLACWLITFILSSLNCIFQEDWGEAETRIHWRRDREMRPSRMQKNPRYEHPTPREPHYWEE